MTNRCWPVFPYFSQAKGGQQQQNWTEADHHYSIRSDKSQTQKHGNMRYWYCFGKPKSTFSCKLPRSNIFHRTATWDLNQPGIGDIWGHRSVYHHEEVIITIEGVLWWVDTSGCLVQSNAPWRWPNNVLGIWRLGEINKQFTHLALGIPTSALGRGSNVSWMHMMWLTHIDSVNVRRQNHSWGMQCPRNTMFPCPIDIMFIFSLCFPMVSMTRHIMIS